MTDRDRKLAMADEFRRLAVSRQRHADKLSDEAQALHREADAIEAEARAEAQP